MQTQDPRQDEHTQHDPDQIEPGPTLIHDRIFGLCGIDKDLDLVSDPEAVHSLGMAVFRFVMVSIRSISLTPESVFVRKVVIGAWMIEIGGMLRLGTRNPGRHLGDALVLKIDPEGADPQEQEKEAHQHQGQFEIIGPEEGGKELFPVVHS